MMKKLVTLLFFAGLALLALVIVAPGFIDWSAHRQTVVARIQPYLSRAIAVNGNVSLQIVPVTKLMLQDVTLANAEGGKAPYLMKLNQLDVSVNFKALLEGRVEIESLTLTAPDIHLEILPDGRSNWAGVLVDQPRRSAIPGRGDTLVLRGMTVTDATVSYTNAASGAAWQVSDVDAAITAAGLMGPYQLEGAAAYKGTAGKLTVATLDAWRRGEALRFTAAFLPVEKLPQIKIDGAIGTGSGLDVSGKVELLQGRIASLFDNPFVRSVGMFDDVSNLTAEMDYKGSTLSLKNIDADFNRFGPVTGRMVFVTDGESGAISVSGDVAFDNLDLSAWLAADWLKGRDIALTVRAKKMAWHWLELSSARAVFENKSGVFSLPSFGGQLWGGKAEGSYDGETAVIKLDAADLEQARKHFQLEGFTLGKGDVTATLSSLEPPEGTVTVKSATLGLAAFDPAAAVMEKLSAEAIEKLDEALRRPSTCRDLTAGLTLKDRTAKIDKAGCKHAAAVVSFSGSYDVASRTAAVTTSAQLEDQDAPAFSAEKTGDLRDWLTKKIPPPPPPAPEPALPVETEAGSSDDNAIGAILDRLDEEEDPLQDAPPQPAPPLPEQAEEVLPPVPVVPIDPEEDAAQVLDDAEALPQSDAQPPL